MTLRSIASLLLVGSLASGAFAQKGASDVLVNGHALPAPTVQALQQAYRVAIAPGRYWYDAVSGAWGTEGGPIAGQMMPGLRLGLTSVEVAALQQACRTAVYRGRYWVNAQGIGGYEGGPPIFNLAACGERGGSRGSSTRTYCDDAGNCSSHGLWGWISTTR